jgi:hypothetical protein
VDHSAATTHRLSNLSARLSATIARLSSSSNNSNVEKIKSKLSQNISSIVEEPAAAKQQHADDVLPKLDSAPVPVAPTASSSAARDSLRAAWLSFAAKAAALGREVRVSLQHASERARVGAKATYQSALAKKQ